MRRSGKRWLLLLLIGYLITLPYCFADAETEKSTTLFESPLACVQQFNSCLLHGDFEGVMETFAADVQASCLEYRAYDYALQYSEEGEQTRKRQFNKYKSIDQDYSVVNRVRIETQIAYEICGLIKRMFIPSEWNIKKYLIGVPDLIVGEDRVIRMSDNDQKITIDEYFDSVSAEHLSQVKVVAVCEMKEWEEENRTRALKNLNIKYCGNIAELRDMVIVYSYNDEMYFVGIRLGNFIDRGWAILEFGNRYLKYETYSEAEIDLVSSTWGMPEAILHEVNWDLLLAGTTWDARGENQGWIEFGSENTVEMYLESLGVALNGTYSCTGDQLTFSFYFQGKQREIKATVKQELNKKAAEGGYDLLDTAITFPCYRFQMYWYSY